MKRGLPSHSEGRSSRNYTIALNPMLRSTGLKYKVTAETVAPMRWRNNPDRVKANQPRFVFTTPVFVNTLTSYVPPTVLDLTPAKLVRVTAATLAGFKSTRT